MVCGPIFISHAPFFFKKIAEASVKCHLPKKTGYSAPSPATARCLSSFLSGNLERHCTPSGCKPDDLAVH